MSKIDLARKLKQVTMDSNASQGEIANAMALLRKILNENGITEEEIRNGTSEESKLMELDYSTIYDRRSNENIWFEDMLCYISEAFDIKILICQREKLIYKMFGFRQDIQAFMLYFLPAHMTLYRMAISQASSCRENGKKLTPTKFRDYVNSFCKGAGLEIRKKLKQVDIDCGQQGLVLYKKSEVDKFFKEKYPNTGRVSGIGKLNYGAYENGQVAGRNYGQSKVGGFSQALIG